MNEEPRVSDPNPATVAAQAEDERLELKPFFLAAALWLPLSFFIWFMLRSAVVFPVIRMVEAVLGSWMPELVARVGQTYHAMDVDLLAQLGAVPGLPGGVLEVTTQINVLPYCYSIPVLMGLSIATPISWARTGFQLALGIPILFVVQAFGVMGDVLKRIAFDLSGLVHGGLVEQGYAAVAGIAAQNAQDAALAALQGHGLTPAILGVWFQFGYLILPPISAVVLWILFNRRFIEALRLQPRPA